MCIHPPPHTHHHHHPIVQRQAAYEAERARSGSAFRSDLDDASRCGGDEEGEGRIGCGDHVAAPAFCSRADVATRELRGLQARLEAEAGDYAAKLVFLERQMAVQVRWTMGGQGARGRGGSTTPTPLRRRRRTRPSPC